MDPTALTAYTEAFARLHRNTHRTRGAAPHLPILLLAVLAEIDAGRIRDNRVRIVPELVAAFHVHWDALVPADAGWNPRMATPFVHLTGEGFWNLVKDDAPVVLPKRPEPTLSQIALLSEGARFDAGLWELLADPTARGVLRQTLLATYFPERALPPDAVETYLHAQARALENQAQARFKSLVHEPRSDDAYFVRHHLFPGVVRALYGHACCVCRLSLSIGGASVVEAAHILPFADFHNDDPRNGLALCPNHHWGFDRGAWSLTDDARVRVAPGLRGGDHSLESGRPIVLPGDSRFHPDPEALAWHRKNVLRANP